MSCISIEYTGGSLVSHRKSIVVLAYLCCFDGWDHRAKPNEKKRSFSYTGEGGECGVYPVTGSLSAVSAGSLAATASSCVYVLLLNLVCV